MFAIKQSLYNLLSINERTACLILLIIALFDLTISRICEIYSHVGGTLVIREADFFVIYPHRQERSVILFSERNRLSRPRFWGLPCQADAESTMLMCLSRDLFFLFSLPISGSNGAPSAFRVSLVAMVVDEYVRYALLYLACL